MKDQCYEFIKGLNNKVNIVGFGSYGQVKLAKNYETDQIVAIKMIHGKNAKDEIDVHHKLNHPNIVKLLNYYYQKDKNTTYMVLEYAEGGSLNQKIKFGYGNLPKDKIKKYFTDICKAVQYLHSLKYMHRDIKPQNILLATHDCAKLCDFGFAAILEYRSTLCGTHQYMAPQMIQQKPYDYKVDVWALGILLFQMIQGTAPFRGQTGQDVIKEMKKPIIFSNRFQKEEIDLIKKILRVNGENRPEVSKILEHPYFQNIKREVPAKKQKLNTQISQSTGTISSINSTPTSTPSRTKTQNLNDYENNVKSEKIQKVDSIKNLQKTQKIFSIQNSDKIDKKIDPQFKPYIPQNTKPYFTLNKPNIPVSPSSVGTQNYQGLQQKTNKNIIHQNPTNSTSSSTSFKQINLGPQTNASQKPTFNGYQKQINSPTSFNQIKNNTSINCKNSSLNVRKQ